MLGSRPSPRLRELVKELRASWPNYVWRGHFLFEKRADSVLSGLYFQPTIQGKGLRYVSAGNEVLFLPNERCPLFFTERISERVFPVTKGFLETDDDYSPPRSFEQTLQIIEEIARPAVEAGNTLEKIRQRALEQVTFMDLGLNRNNEFIREIAGYCELKLLGPTDLAHRTLVKAGEMALQTWSDDMFQITARSIRMVKLIDADDNDSIQRLLNEYEAYTRGKLTWHD